MLKFSELLTTTGLQIKTDPGIPLIYTGFLFLMLSTLISYITYSQIWIVQSNKQMLIERLEYIMNKIEMKQDIINVLENN